MTLSVEGGGARVAIAAHGRAASDIRLGCTSPGFPVADRKRYRLSFDATVDADTSITVTITENGNDINKDGSAWGPHALADFVLAAGTRSYSAILSCKGTNPRAGLLILLGKCAGDVRVSKVSLRELP